MTTCTCHDVDWFHIEPKEPYTLTICCPVHGDPNGLQPTQYADLAPEQPE